MIDDDGNEMPPGIAGRLAVRGPTGCRYLADPRQANYVQSGWNVTGDTYVMDADGYFWYQARSDDMIISSGYNIAGPEVEAALLDPSGGRRMRRGRRARRGARPDRQGLCRAARRPDRRRGADQGACRTTSRRRSRRTNIRAPSNTSTELPKTQTGKLQRFELRKMAADSRRAEDGVVGRHVRQTCKARQHDTLCSRPAGRKPKGYANGIKARGEIVFVGGMVGWDEDEKFPEGFVAQARQALQNIVAVLAEGGARPEHIVRMTWYVRDMDEYLAARKELGAAYREVMGRTSRPWRWSRCAAWSSRRRGWRSRRRRWCRSSSPTGRDTPARQTARTARSRSR